MLYLPSFLNDAVPEEHKSGIATAQRLNITATTLDVLTVQRQGQREAARE